MTAKGSTGYIAGETAKAAAERGYRCVLFFGRGNAPEDRTFTSGGSLLYRRMENVCEVLLHGAKARFLGKNGHGSKHATKKLVEELIKEDPEIIQLHNIHGYYLDLDILFSYLKKYKGKIFWTLHDCWSFTGGCAHFTGAKCEKWKSGCGKCPALNVYPKSYKDRTNEEYIHKKELFTGIGGMTLIVPCRWLKKQAQASFLGGYHIEVIENGTDTQYWSQETETDIKNDENGQKTGFSRNALPEKMKINKKYILGVASVWDARKRPDVFGKTGAILSKYGYVSLAIGKAPGGIKIFTGKDDPEGYIIHIDRTEDRDMLRSLYRGAVCLVSTSVEDTFPTIGLEAMACGTPVVYADVCGCPEQVREDKEYETAEGETVISPETGIVAKADVPEDFAKAVLKIDENREFYSNNCLIRAKERYDKSIMAEKYLKAWKLGS